MSNNFNEISDLLVEMNQKYEIAPEEDPEEDIVDMNYLLVSEDQ